MARPQASPPRDEGRYRPVPGAGTARPAEDKTRKVHFFPLPFNREQGKISDMIDDPKVHVACVSGPPGTGKSHSIANIISHQMALGKRVLVTARTPEAIAAVREKLPEALRPLVIASVGTDRESAQQLQDAVQELSREVVSLDADQAQAERARLEAQIVECDEIAAEADRKLSEIARANLVQIDWNGARPTPMELVEILSEGEDRHDWFTDRPEKQPPAQLDEVLSRLRTTLPRLAADIVYAGADLPAPAALPGTADLISAHWTELAWNTREVVDYSAAPRMARDSAGADVQARAVLAELEALSHDLADMDPRARSFAVRALGDEGPIDHAALDSISRFLRSKKSLEPIARIRFDLGECAFDEFQSAVVRGASGQKPVGFGLFNGSLKAAVASVRIDGKAPADADDWLAVLEACRLEGGKAEIGDTIRPLVSAKLMTALPETPWDIARHLQERQAELAAGLAIADRMTPVLRALEDLFPYGLDTEQMRASLDCDAAIFAVRGNLPDSYVSPEPLERLRSIPGASQLPIQAAIRQLADALGRDDTDPQDIVEARGEITEELTRLAEVAKDLEALGRDLEALREAGAPDWAARLEETPDQAPELIPETWRDAWSWAEMKGRVDRIISLGNGDDHRQTKAEAMKRRRRLFEELIRTRTLLGLKRRMTGSIRQAMEAFTQAVSKIGTGKGKKAPRFIKAARDAAKQASSAAPVWIMPEYKIPEQLPADFGDFDLVILDEASQSDITALAALARGKKILVVGDEEQVSPSAVGVPVQKINALRAEFLDGLPNSGLIDENTSIFEITKRMHPESHVMLREHFRCVAPIIQFSTRFYNNALVPLRVPKASERFDPPLADVYIPGATRQGKTNPFEARWIVDEIARLIEDPAHEGRDIGVISLIGSEQAEKIGRMLVEDPRVGPEKIEERRIIYGDARTMQGQERSIVFLSMVATPGHAHAQTMKADQQRINVAMSRARDRLYLVRSVQLEDLKPADIKAQILQHFADPMPDGRGATLGEVEDLMDRCDSGFEREVLKALMEANYRVRPQVAAGGFRIDLVVEGPEDRRLAIELDGDQYHGPDVWDDDMTRQAALERAGWVFWRVFGSQWKANRDFWWRNLRDTLDRLEITPIGAAAMDERFTETILVDSATEDSDPTPVVASSERSPAPGAPAAAADTADTPTPASQPATETSALTPTDTVDTTPEPAAEASGAPSGRGSAARQEADPVPAPSAAATASDYQRPRQAGFDLDDNDLFAVAERNGARSIVTIGSTVRLEKLGNGGGKLEVTLVEEGHDADRGMIGVHTPLGQALLDAEVGDDVEYRAGAYLQEVRVLHVT
ncbi:MAG: GreA/GreB family elongation factor [Roseivivax sp.]|nr:GreA/GreB family elongation factor [Roseivivax sp.]